MTAVDEARYVLVPRDQLRSWYGQGIALWLASLNEDEVDETCPPPSPDFIDEIARAASQPGNVDREAIARVERYVLMRREKPLRLTNNSIHAVHTGTEWEAELRLSDLEIVLALIRGEG